MNLSPVPIQKFFDNNGAPLVSGLLFTYVAGTSTKIATYTDSSGGTPNTNPIVLNYRGECALWIDPTKSYKFVLAPSTDTDPPGNPIWTIDNITAGPAQQDNAAVDTGSVNNIAISIPLISSPVAFTRIVFKAANTNTGAVTITINGGTAKNLTWQNLAALDAGEIQAGGLYQAVFDGAQWQLQGPSLLAPYQRAPVEVTAGVTPSSYGYPQYDIRRLGAVCDGTTDDTTAVRNAALIGGLWQIPNGGKVRITGTITITKATGFYSLAPVSTTTVSGGTQAFMIHDFNGTFFDLVGSASSDKLGSGCAFIGVSLVQNDGNGSSSSGVCIRNVATSDLQKCPWLVLDRFHIENESGKNDWTGGILLDGTANTSGTQQLRDIFISNGRLVAGTNASYAIKSNGAQNIWLSNIEGNLSKADLILTGDATHLTSSVFINGCTFSTITLDYASNVFGGGNSASTFTSSANTVDVALGVSLGSSQTILGTRVTIYGKSAGGKFQIASNNNVRMELGSNPFELSGPLSIGTNPAAGGDIRLANAGAIKGRNVGNTADVEIAKVSSGDRVQIANADNCVLGGTGKTLGFYGSAGDVLQVVTGSRGGNAALGSLLVALANLGFITNSTSA